MQFAAQQIYRPADRIILSPVADYCACGDDNRFPSSITVYKLDLKQDKDHHECCFRTNPHCAE